MNTISRGHQTEWNVLFPFISRPFCCSLPLPLRTVSNTPTFFYWPTEILSLHVIVSWLVAVVKKRSFSLFLTKHCNQFSHLSNYVLVQSVELESEKLARRDCGCWWNVHTYIIIQFNLYSNASHASAAPHCTVVAGRLYARVIAERKMQFITVADAPRISHAPQTSDGAVWWERSWKFHNFPPPPPPLSVALVLL